MDESVSFSEMKGIAEDLFLSSLRTGVLCLNDLHQFVSFSGAGELEQVVLEKHKERLAARKAKWAKKYAPKSIEQRLDAMPTTSKYKLEVHSIFKLYKLFSSVRV